jgi:hypothetical protein
VAFPDSPKYCPSCGSKMVSIIVDDVLKYNLHWVDVLNYSRQCLDVLKYSWHCLDSFNCSHVTWMVQLKLTLPGWFRLQLTLPWWFQIKVIFSRWSEIQLKLLRWAVGPCRNIFQSLVYRGIYCNTFSKKLYDTLQ